MGEVVATGAGSRGGTAWEGWRWMPCARLLPPVVALAHLPPHVRVAVRSHDRVDVALPPSVARPLRGSLHRSGVGAAHSATGRSVRRPQDGRCV